MAAKVTPECSDPNGCGKEDCTDQDCKRAAAMMVWHCSGCTKKNDPANVKCQNCGTLSPSYRNPEKPVRLDFCADIPVVYMELAIQLGSGKQRIGKIEIALRVDMKPDVAKRFENLCTATENKQVTYKNTTIQWIIPDKFFIAGAGKKGFELSPRHSESKLAHDGAGVVSVWHVNGDQSSATFHITFKKDDKLKNSCVAFGRVTTGYKTLAKLESASRGTIVDCGKLSPLLSKEQVEFTVKGWLECYSYDWDLVPLALFGLIKTFIGRTEWN